MKKFLFISRLRAALALSLISILAIQAAAAPIQQAATLHLSTEFKLRSGVFALSYFRTWGELIENFPSTTDRSFLKSVLKDELQSPVQLKYLEQDTLLLKDSQGQLPIEFVDMDHFKISVFKKTFTFEPGESAEAAIGRMQRQLATTGRGGIFLPNAEASPIVLALRLAGVFVTAWSIFSTDCAVRGMNSPWTCIKDGPRKILEITMAVSLGMILLAKEQVKKRLGNKTFELDDLQCPKGDDPLRAKVVDSSKVVTTVSIYLKDHRPDRVDIQGDDPKPFSVYLSPDWKASMDRVPKDEPAYDPQSSDLIAEAAKNLANFCKDGDSKAAMQRYHRMQNGALTTTVNPEPDQPSATTK